MKRKIVALIHSIFRIRIFEMLLRAWVKGRYVDSFLAKFVPPNHTYRNATLRTMRDGELALQGNLQDYNDWKAYWRLSEVERESLYALAATSTNIIDVGTNNGWVLLNMARIVKPREGFVFGFEPFPPTYARAMRNIEASNLSNCRLANMGCSDSSGELQMVAEISSNSGQNRIVQNPKEIKEKSLVSVKVVTLDDEFRQASKIDLIKIDVEGFEMNVLRGAAHLLQRDRPALFVEIDDKLLSANGASPAEILGYLYDGFGYQFYNAATKAPISREQNLKGCHFDLIALTPESPHKF